MSTSCRLITSQSHIHSILQEERGSSKYSTTFLYLRGISAAQSDWLLWQLSYPVLGLPYRKPLSFDLLSTPPTYWSPASNFKGLAFSRIHGVKLYYSPDPPSSLEESLHGYETDRFLLCWTVGCGLIEAKRSGEYIVQNFCRSLEYQWHDVIGWFG